MLVSLEPPLGWHRCLTCAGLFAPAVGQHFRYEQRYRNSQFDRGTSMAIREREFDDNFAGGYIDFPTHNGENNLADLIRGHGGFGDTSDALEFVRGRGGFARGGHRGNCRGNSGYDFQGPQGPPFG